MMDVPTTEPDRSASGAAASAAPPLKPLVVLVVGMAGSGKTSFMQRMNAHLHAAGAPPYVINLDPAVTNLPYGANIDIRDTVNYKEVMKQYNLGPNGGILTASNLFATRFDQVVALLSARAAAGTLGTVLVDTPGQIEIFTWSASGQLISEALATHFRTVVVFVLDTPRCAAPQTFASNMLQAVSILYKLQLPMVLAFNKIDVVRPDAMLSWMDDFEVFHDALDAAPQSGYSSDLARSLSLVLDEFYRGLTTVGVSALTGEGCDDMVAALQKAGDAYDATYAVDLAARRAAITQEQTAKQAATLARFRGDHAADAAGAAEAAAAKGGSVAVHPGAMRRAEAEEEDSDDEEEGAARREGLDEYDDEDEE